MLTLPAQQAAAESDPAPLSEGQQALAKAKESGQRVEVLGERSERTTVFANPDGDTFTLEESVVPVRVATPGGGWQAPDATLEKRSDGSVGPKAAAVQITLSPGGDSTPLAVIEDEGRSLELQWPGALPAPQLDGSNALYTEVLPGVDLKVTTTPESMQQVFVVKTHQAAASDELRKLTFGLKTDGLELRKGPSGNLAAVDENGRTVFRAPPARMWDSAGVGDASGTQTQLMTVDTPGATAAEPSDPSEAAPSGSGLEPGQGDTVARMDVSVTEDSLSVAPDPEMLAQTEASAFPLFIDPPVTWGSSERTLLRSDGYESYGWSNGEDGQGKGAGKCGTWNGYYCGPGYVQKLYFEFSPAKLTGKKVLDATFRVTEPWAFQCDPRWVDLVRTNNISSSTTWSTRPAELDWMVDRYVSAGRGSLCDPDAPDAPIEFHDNPEETNENLTPTVQAFAEGKFSRLTLEIRAHDESDTSAWKRFKNDAVLAVTFVGLPDKPTGLTVNGVCSKDVNDPAVVSDPTPPLRAVAQTKAGGEYSAQLRVYFDLDHRNSDGSWTDTPAGNGSLWPTTSPVEDNDLVTMSWPALSEGVLYRYHAWTWSYYDNGTSYLSSAASDGFCYFVVDAEAPKPPQINIGAPYTECVKETDAEPGTGTQTCEAHGGPGIAAPFSLTSADTSVVGYEYRLSDTTTWSRIDGRTVTVRPIPQRSGVVTFQVRSRDGVGVRTGEIGQMDFSVDKLRPVGQWHFAEDADAAVDSATSDGSAQDATLTGGAQRDDRGRRGEMTRDASGTPLETRIIDKGLSLNGSTAYAATSSKVLDTSASYTVSAWVRVDAGASHTMTALTQSPDSGSPLPKKYIPFGLSYAGGGSNTWSMSLLDSAGTLHKASAQQATPSNVWTHVAGVYDAEQKTASLYLNGKLQARVDAGTAWNAVGPLQIGRGIWADNYVDYLDGSIDEVTVWPVALTDTLIADDAKLALNDGFNWVEMVADWSADQGSGTVVPDKISNYGRSLTLTGGAALDGETVVLDGVDDAATTAGPIVDDTGSFTVSTLVQLDGEKVLAKGIGYVGQVLGQRRADGSSWGIWYKLDGTRKTIVDGVLKTLPVGQWSLGWRDANGTFTGVTDAGEAEVDSPVRLTGVFDAQAGTVALYVGAASKGELSGYTAQMGSGDFSIGKGISGGSDGLFLPGRVTQVYVWSGAMAGSDQVGEIVGG